jgi:hypothetical protein
MSTLAALLAEINAMHPSPSSPLITRDQLAAILVDMATSEYPTGGATSYQPGDDIVYLEDFAPAGTGAVNDWTPVVAAAVASFPTQVENTTSFKGRVLMTHRPGQQSRRALTNGVYPFTTPARAGSNFAIELNGQVTLEGIGRPGLNAFGITALSFAPGLSGIAAYYTQYPTPSSDDGTGATLKNLSLIGNNGNAPGTSGSVGVYFNTVVYMDTCEIYRFDSHGVIASSDLDPIETNSSLSQIVNCDSHSNGGDGYHTFGGDSNAILFLNCKARNNVGWGFYDDSFLGCYWVGGQVESNLSGGVHANKTGGCATFVGVYAENDQFQNINVPGTVFGGTLGNNCVSGRNAGNGVAFGADAVVPGIRCRPVVTGGIYPPVLSNGEIGFGNAHNNPTSLLALKDWNEAGGAYLFRLNYEVGSGGFMWNYANSSVGLMRFVNSRCTVANGWSRNAFDVPAVNNSGGIAFENGFFLGGQAGVIFMGVASAAPTAGTWQRGDKLLNISPSAGGTEGWICVSSGTPGAWKTFGTVEA